MGMHKPSLALAPGSPPLGALALSQLLDCRWLDVVLVVVNPSDRLEWLEDVLAAHASRIVIVRCEDAGNGMSYSLKAGVREARARSPEGVLIALADQPFVTTELLGRLVAAFEAERLDYVACAGGLDASPPALLGPAMFADIERLEGDAGARKLLISGRYRGRRITVDRPHELLDVDDQVQLRQAEQLWKMYRRGDHGA